LGQRRRGDVKGNTKTSLTLSPHCGLLSAGGLVRSIKTNPFCDTATQEALRLTKTKYRVSDETRLAAPIIDRQGHGASGCRHAGRKAHLAVAGHRAEGDLSELLLNERAVRDAADGHALLGEHDGVVVAVEHETDYVLLGHLGQLLVEDLLECVGGGGQQKPEVARKLGSGLMRP